MIGTPHLVTRHVSLVAFLNRTKFNSNKLFLSENLFRTDRSSDRYGYLGAVIETRTPNPRADITRIGSICRC